MVDETGLNKPKVDEKVVGKIEESENVKAVSLLPHCEFLHLPNDRITH